MPSLVATTSTPARKPFVRTHYVRTNNAKFSGHYFYPRTETVRAHALRSHQQVRRNTISCCAQVEKKKTTNKYKTRNRGK